MIVNNKLGIVLSGGGFKSLAQLGALHYLHEIKMPFHAVSGTSAGALIGAFMAAGFAPYQILNICKNERIFSYTYLSIKNNGLFSTSMLENIIKKHIPHNSFEELKIPFYASATNLNTAELLTFNAGNLSTAVCASCSFPLVFQPVAYNNDFLCDGGLLNNFPIDPVYNSCQYIIGINVNPINRIEGNFNYKQLLYRIIRIASSSLKQEKNINDCTIYIEPEAIANYNMFDLNKIDDFFEIGYTHAKLLHNEFIALKENMEH